MVLCTWTRGSRVRCAPRQRRPGRAARAAGRRTRSLPDSLESLIFFFDSREKKNINNTFGAAQWGPLLCM